MKWLILAGAALAFYAASCWAFYSAGWWNGTRKAYVDGAAMIERRFPELNHERQKTSN